MDDERARELLQAERRRIEESLARLRGRDESELSDQDDEMGDQATELYDEELDAGFEEQLRAELAALERAEERLEAGTYGLSVESGEPIPDERLEVRPSAERTVDEERRYERG